MKHFIHIFQIIERYSLGNQFFPDFIFPSTPPGRSQALLPSLTDLLLLSSLCPQCTNTHRPPLNPNQAWRELIQPPSPASWEELGMSKSFIGVILGAKAELWLEATH